MTASHAQTTLTTVPHATAGGGRLPHAHALPYLAHTPLQCARRQQGRGGVLPPTRASARLHEQQQQNRRVCALIAPFSCTCAPDEQGGCEWQSRQQQLLNTDLIPAHIAYSIRMARSSWPRRHNQGEGVRGWRVAHTQASTSATDDAHNACTQTTANSTARYSDWAPRATPEPAAPVCVGGAHTVAHTPTHKALRLSARTAPRPPSANTHTHTHARAPTCARARAPTCPCSQMGQDARQPNTDLTEHQSKQQSTRAHTHRWVTSAIVCLPCLALGGMPSCHAHYQHAQR